MKHHDPEVLVLDDDAAILTSLERLLTEYGYRVRLHQDAESFFRAGLPKAPACLILDNQLGDGSDGLQVYAEIQRRGWQLPTVFVTAHWNVKTVVNAIRHGADGFLTKPYDPAALLDAVAQALQRSKLLRRENTQQSAAADGIASLTPREREVLARVVAGKLNKEIAAELDISIVTVKVHRGRAMRKLGAGNTAQLAHIAALAGLIP